MQTRSQTKRSNDMARLQSLPKDILVVTFEQLVGDYTTLKNVGLTCRAWRELSLPSLLHHVDISFHNHGRIPEREKPKCSFMPFQYADQRLGYCPETLRPRQEAFLRLLTQQQELARHVKSLTWTMAWSITHFDGDSAEMVWETWNVFSRLTSVTHLDLASLHEAAAQPFVRQNPATLFPRVTNLRLVGHMHRGLVEAIMRHPDKLRSLDLHYLDDDGALPGGMPMVQHYAQQHSHPYGGERTIWNADNLPLYYRPDNTIGEELYQRQQSGEAWTFPGPMWIPLRVLSRSGSQLRLTSLKMTVAPFVDEQDMRNCNTFFNETSQLLSAARGSLRIIDIKVGDPPNILGPNDARPPNFNSRRVLEVSDISYRELLETFLGCLSNVFDAEGFHPDLRVKLRGFSLLDGTYVDEDTATDEQQAIFQRVRALPFVDEDSMEVVDLDFHQPFLGHEYGPKLHVAFESSIWAALPNS